MQHGEINPLDKGSAEMATKTKRAAMAMDKDVEQATASRPHGPEPTGERITPRFPDYAAFAELSRANVAAMIKANAALTQGIEALSHEVMDLAKLSFESTTHTATALLGAKTIEDVIELNTEFATSNLTRLLDGGAKLQEIGVKTASDALLPLGDQVEAAIGKLVKPMAA